jgi:membrane protein DedA with SNARE-associated domain
MEELIRSYGYLACFVGTFFEGETVLVIASFAARRGYLDLRAVIVVAAVGSLAGDQFFFLLGRIRGRALLAARPAWQARARRADEVLAQHRTTILFSFRFLVGLRMILPFVLGMGGMSAVRFLAFNVVGAAIWSLTIGAAGYAFGATLELLLEDIEHFEIETMLAIAVIGFMLWLRRLIRQRRAARSREPRPQQEDP